MSGSVPPPPKAVMPTVFSAITPDNTKAATIALICQGAGETLVCNGVDMQVREGSENTTLHVEGNGKIMVTYLDAGRLKYRNDADDEDLAKFLIEAAKRTIAGQGAGDDVRIHQTKTLIEDGLACAFPKKDKPPRCP